MVAACADSVLSDSEAAAALEDALGPEPWQPQDPATAAKIQRHISETAGRLLEKLYADHPIEESHVLSTADIDRYDGDISVRDARVDLLRRTLISVVWYVCFASYVGSR